MFNRHMYFQYALRERIKCGSAKITMNVSLPVISVRYSSAGHLDVIAAQEEEQRVAGEADGVGDEDELHGALGPQLQPLE